MGKGDKKEKTLVFKLSLHFNIIINLILPQVLTKLKKILEAKLKNRGLVLVNDRCLTVFYSSFQEHTILQWLFYGSLLGSTVSDCMDMIVLINCMLWNVWIPSKPSSEAELDTEPIQLVASHVYVPRQHVPSWPEMIRWMSPGLSSRPSLYHLRVGWGVPITCKSKLLYHLKRVIERSLLLKSK